MSETTFGRLVFEPRLTDDPRTTPARTPENEAAQSPSLMLLVLLASAGIVIYAVFLLNPGNRGDWLPFLLVIGAEAILVGQALLSMWTILSSGHNPRGFAFHHAQDGLYDVADIMRQRIDDTPQRWRMYLRDRPVTVDVFITTYGEDLDTIRRTVTAAVAMQGEHLTWVLDDGRSDAVRELTAELGARYVRRLTSNGVKAGNVNHALSLTRGELFVILDADFVPLPTFLHETVPFFASDDVAFVQTPQTYGNLHNLISRGAGYMQSVFYRFIQPGRNRFNAAFCVGTNVIFRRAAIDQIGGMYSDSKSEDVWTLIHLHEQGWRSIYIPTTLAIGDTPETIEAYTKQQLRWATGGFEILFTHNPLSRKRRLTLDQRLQYLVTATHYLGGITPLALLLVPPLQIFFDLTPMNIHLSPLAWALFYAGFYGMQILVAFYTPGSFRWGVSSGCRAPRGRPSATVHRTAPARVRRSTRRCRMTWGNRIRLTSGLVLVVVAAALATYHLNESEAVAASSSAQIAAKTYDVGSPYAGLVVDQPVEVGDTVKTGDALFVIDSAALQHDIAIGLGPASSPASEVDADGHLVIRATGPGVVRALTATRGSFVQASGQLAVVEKSETLYVLADHVLSRKEYARIGDQAAVTIVLPNQQKLAGHVERVDVTTVANKAQATITVASDELVAGEANGLVSAGTPVTAELHLRNDGVVTTVAESVKRYLRGIRL